jgi:Outer membrane protein beta-barrel domain
MKKLLLAMIFSGFVSVPVFADSVNVLFGYAIPRGDSDVYQQNEAETTFRVKDLNDFIGSVGYDHFFGDHISLGGNFAYYQGETTVQDRLFLFPDGRPAFRDIRLEIVPLEIALKVLPIGRNVPVIPYFGGGGGIYYWQYEEVGDFVINRNTADPRIISGTAYSDGYDPGWHVEGGVQIPVARSIALQFEAKYWQAKGNLDVTGFDPSFEPLDLSGSSYSGGVSFWF